MVETLSILFDVSIGLDINLGFVSHPRDLIIMLKERRKEVNKTPTIKNGSSGCQERCNNTFHQL
jgi:hypothetical protein